MIDTKKEQERDELHRAIWAIADELRGAVDGWDFKNYVLGTMFYRYISENLTNYINSGEGEGLLFYGNVILPFIDRFPTDTELYRIMTTKLSDMSDNTVNSTSNIIR